MRRNARSRVAAIVCLALALTWTTAIGTAEAQSGGGGAGGCGAGGPAAGGGMGSPGSTGSGGFGMSRGKNLDGTVKTPPMPGVSPLQRDRARRLEEKLRQGEAPATTPQTQMSDRLEQLHKNSSPGQSDSHIPGQ